MSEAVQLKHWFDEARYLRIAADLTELHPGFDRKRFLAHTLDGELSRGWAGSSTQP